MREDKFFQQIKELYGDSINILSYEDTKDLSEIKCSCAIHGEFTAKVHNLVHHKTGCPLCRAESSKSPYKSTEQLIYKLRKIYGDAFNAYKKAKEGYIKQVAKELFSKGEITEKVYEALLNYNVRQYDE